jgi:hypothetical protein
MIAVSIHFGSRSSAPDCQPARELLHVPAAQFPRLGPPRRELGDDRVRARELHAAPRNERVEPGVHGVMLAQRLEIRALVAAPEDVRLHRQN